jgi:hypothetical protein
MKRIFTYLMVLVIILMSIGGCYWRDYGGHGRGEGHGGVEKHGEVEKRGGGEKHGGGHQ